MHFNFNMSLSEVVAYIDEWCTLFFLHSSVMLLTLVVNSNKGKQIQMPLLYKNRKEDLMKAKLYKNVTNHAMLLNRRERQSYLCSSIGIQKEIRLNCSSEVFIFDSSQDFNRILMKLVLCFVCVNYYKYIDNLTPVIVQPLFSVLCSSSVRTDNQLCLNYPFFLFIF
jgi:hypothetical protein